MHYSYYKENDNPQRRALAIPRAHKCTRIVLCAVGNTHARYCYWWAGPLIFIQLVVAYHLAESQSLACYTIY